MKKILMVLFLACAPVAWADTIVVQHEGSYDFYSNGGVGIYEGDFYSYSSPDGSGTGINLGGTEFYDYQPAPDKGYSRIIGARFGQLAQGKKGRQVKRPQNTIRSTRQASSMLRMVS